MSGRSTLIIAHTRVGAAFLGVCFRNSFEVVFIWRRNYDLNRLYIGLLLKHKFWSRCTLGVLLKLDYVISQTNIDRFMWGAKFHSTKHLYIATKKECKIETSE